MISEEANKFLMGEITKPKIQELIWHLNPDKAPGLDGFSINFYRAFWTLIKNDLIHMLNYSKSKDKFRGNTNSSFLALIPKESNPSNFSRFRPNSLCNSTYKILTKVIASLLKKFLPDFISENQEGFMQSRHILDNIKLVQEAIHSSKEAREVRIVVKLDMANAFDKVRHSFLYIVLEKLGFCVEFIIGSKSMLALLG